MKLELVRDASADGATIGSLAVNGVFQNYTLEDVVREVEGEPVESWKIPGETAIPRGRYLVIIDHSNHFNRELPRLLDVPGYEGVRIHSGNIPSDTEGCILVGETKSIASIGMSRIAFDALFEKMEAAYVRKEPITIEIK